jgi:GT2 family glycosyltransferase/MoaA/NifB/PqqE/SkfB family radical SAM enzyme/Flp pilus assembly protein TadD
MGNHGTGSSPRVTVVLPTYNHLSHLPAGIGSILAQTSRDFELVVVNDGSTDGTKEYLDRLTDPRIRVIHQENRRLPGALNAGMAQARGELLTWTSADNILAPDFIEVMCAAFDAYPEAGLAVSGFAWIDERDEVVRVTSGQELSYPSLLCANPGIASFMYRRECHEAVGFYDTEIEGAEDWDMWIRIVEKFQPILVDAVPYYYRTHADTMTARIPEKIRLSCRKAFEKAIGRIGGLPSAEALYPAIAECSDPSAAEAHADFDFGTRLLLAPSGFLDHAAAYLGKAVAIRPDFHEAAFNLALACGRAGDRDGLFAAIDRLSLASPRTAQELLGHLGNDIEGWRPELFLKFVPMRLAPGSTELERRTAPVRRFVATSGPDAAPEENPHMTEPDRSASAPAPGASPSPGDGRTTSLPRSVHFLMNDLCNSRCIMCGGDYYRSRSGRVITLEKFRTMAANLRLERFESVVLSGAGDPFLDPDLIPIVDYLNRQYPAVQVHFTTNGIALDRAMSERLLAFRIASVNISINAAARATYRRIMQVDRFDDVCRNARDFVDVRRRLGARTVLQFSSALNRINIEELAPLVRLAKEIGADSVNTMYCRFYPKRLRDRVAAEPAASLRDEDSLFFHQSLSDRLVEEADRVACQLGIRLSHDPLFGENAPARRCIWPETEIMVGFDGEVYPCGGAEVHFREKVEGGIYHFGNVMRESIDTFWNGETYRALRLSSRGERRDIPECECCANLMKPGDVRSHIMDWEGPDAPELSAKAAEPSREGIPRGGEPLVSVIVPTHNRPEMLEAALGSILAQTFRDFEIVVVNDAGVEVVDVVARMNTGKNVTYVRHARNRGLAAARNTGIRAARGRYIAYLDDDDLYGPDHLATLVRAMKDGARVAYTDASRAVQVKQGESYVTVGRDIPYSVDFDRDRLLVCNFVPVLCFMHEKSAIEDAGYFDESLTSHEDWELWIRMSRLASFRHIPEVTCEFTWRDDGTTMTSSRRADYLRTTLMVYEKHKGEITGRPDIEAKRRQHLSLNFGHGADESVRTPDDSGKGPYFSIVIPVFNNLGYTEKCIESIAANSGDLVTYDLVVVDNGSSDGTPEFLSTLSGDVRIIRNEENLGFAKACNQGGRAARGRFILFLNNDTEVHPGWLEGMQRAIESRGADICGAKLLYPDGTVQHAGVAFTSAGPFHLFRGFAADAPGVNKVRDLSCVTAACMAVRKPLFDSLGGFDEAFRNGFEDVDFCLRARQAGARIVYTPECTATHHESKTPGRKTNEDWNGKLLAQRWGGKWLEDGKDIYESEGYVMVYGEDGSGYAIDTSQAAFESAEKIGIPDSRELALLNGTERNIQRAIHAEAARKLAGRKNYDDAVAHFGVAIQLGDRTLLVPMGDCLAKAGKLADAEKCYLQALGDDPRSEGALVGLGVLQFMVGELDAAADILGKAAAAWPNSGSALCGLGLVASARGNPEAAREWYRKSLDAEPSNLAAIDGLTRVAFERGEFGDLVDRIRKYLDFDPSNPHLLFSLAAIHQRQGKHAEALDVLDRLELFCPGYDGSAELRGLATKATGDR